ncbi:hypothetical protein C5167_027391 [Papaver somniferum]|uniref:probable WRKY transcription factor 41 n=1 Tax=Papaver somniferum TaxID=3469 RepID=UPI000E7048E1|nr:probable WRKY transcription factor 41 [Papaver somniferum]RZC91330.1 hypothetical protein C5167_027391 [Papaver somniferum]
MLTGTKSEAGNQSQITGSQSDVIQSDSPRSIDRSPCSNYKSDLNGNASKKRKTLQRWTEQVRVCEHTGLEEPVDDGYSWRKYGQKDILGANYPRGYHRCTHSNAQGCLARKQVQRSDEDSSMFSVTYCGRRTCIQGAHLLPGKSQNRQDQQDQRRIKTQETIINFQTSSCHSKTEDFITTQAVLRSPSFSFPSASIPISSCTDKESNNDNNNNNIFSSTTPDNHFMTSPFSSSPTISESSSFSPYQVSYFDGGQNLETSDYEVCEFSSTLDSQDLYLGFDFPYGSQYPFDSPH